MKIIGKTITLSTRGFSDIIDITPVVRKTITESKIAAGLVNIFPVGSTASITTIEFEPALVADMEELLEKIASKEMLSRHSQTWGDDNGFSHLRASLMGPGITVPIDKGQPVLGTWQQIVVIDHDNRPRQRKVYVQVMGEE
ncbi:MAG: YjbQ family protein [Candidatus Marinimicrobia bacterium]|nr:YjbQ family protein [Candidatus Neomarinimicrobiota bacterium]